MLSCANCGAENADDGRPRHKRALEIVKAKGDVALEAHVRERLAGVGVEV